MGPGWVLESIGRRPHLGTRMDEAAILAEDAVCGPDDANVGSERAEFPVREVLAVDGNFFLRYATLDAADVESWRLAKDLDVSFLHGLDDVETI